MKISIIIPIFNIKINKFNELKKFLMTQSIGFDNIEIILVDNNSTYNSPKNFIKNFEKKFENVTCVLLNRNYNDSYPHIKALDYVTTNYVIFYDYQEYYENAYEILYDEISNNDLDIVIGYNEDSNNNFLLNGFMDSNNLFNNIKLSYKIFRSDFIRKINFNGCNSLTQFNYMLNSSTKQIGFLKTPISPSNNKMIDDNILFNSKKLDILNKIVNKQYSDLTISIKTPNTTTRRHWGDYFFALSLKKSFQKKGFNVIVQEREYWDDNDEKIDIVVVLRGLFKYIPNPNHLNLMWNISHPDDIGLEEYEKYDFVFIASKKYAKEISNKIETNVYSLLQCTDPEIFYISKNELYDDEILFVGVTRGVFRKIIKDISKTKHDFSVYGYGWDEYLDKKFVKGSFIENKVLNQAYSSCKILLNDHWDDMLEKDFPSNRLFDALACGTFIISDNIESANELFEGNIITYDTYIDLDKKIDYYLNNESERESLAKKGQKLVLENHTFDNRVDEILNVLHSYEFDNFICNIKTSTTHINNNSNENSKLRIIIVDNNDSNLISKSISSISSISSKIPISILELNNFSQEKFVLDEYNKNFIMKNLNEIIKNNSEDFILIIESGDLVKKELVDKFNEIDPEDYENIGAIIFDDVLINTKEPNYKLGFSPDLYLETDYIRHSAILNRNALLNNDCFNQKLFCNYIRNSILELYQKGYKILKKDVIGLEIRNELKHINNDENELLITKFLEDRNYDSLFDEENECIFPIYNPNNHKASIIIPFKDQVETTKQCVDSILNKTSYHNFEIILVNNNSYESETLDYLSEIEKHEKCRVVNHDYEFNWSKINNYASTMATGDIFVFLNNDTEVISENWLTLLIGDTIQPGVGAVGSKLLYPDDTIQHLGVVIGLTYLAGHIFANEKEKNVPKIYNLHRRNVSAVTGACVAFKKETFNEIGKFDEDYEISFSDVEICLRAMKFGYKNIINPRSILYHHEMKSRGTGDFREIDRILAYNVFEPYLKEGDPFFNHNYSLNSHKLAIKKKNEFPKYNTFWKKFCKGKDATSKSIINARKKVSIDTSNEVLRQEISKHEIANNMILMKNFFMNPKVNLNQVLWFLPIDDIKSKNIHEILRFAELMSEYENTRNYFVLNSPKININKFEQRIGNNFINLNFSLITMDMLNDDNHYDIALCVDWFSAFNLAKFNNCDAKFYFLMPQNFTENIIEQTYKFKFIGITNSKSLLNEYKQNNNLVKYYNPMINQDIFFPFLNEKSKKIKVIFHGDAHNDKLSFDMGIEVLKILQAYFNNKIDIQFVGSKCDLSKYNLDNVINLGEIDSDEELANLYRRSHICLMLSFENLSPTEVLKCMACGCALITNNDKNNHWLLKHRENAVLTEPNVYCIVEDTINLINDYKLRDKIINNGLKTITKFNGKKEFSKILEFMKNPLL